MILSPHGGRGGLRSYIWKGSELSELEKGVRAVISGQKYIDGAILQLLEEKERRRKEEQRVGTQEREQQESLQDIMQIQTLKENLEEDHREKYDNETPLSKRELEILKMLTSGKLNKEIAYELSISEKTVKNHISNIFKKIGVGDRTQAAVYAIKNSIVSL
ncbi:MAG: response regulator transcription factor [Lachnospiraceae bacterium]|nr:response regulator transcription factor [Lachnospiraceae bacterium]